MHPAMACDLPHTWFLWLGSCLLSPGIPLLPSLSSTGQGKRSRRKTVAVGNITLVYAHPNKVRGWIRLGFAYQCSSSPLPNLFIAVTVCRYLPKYTQFLFLNMQVVLLSFIDASGSVGRSHISWIRATTMAYPNKYFPDHNGRKREEVDDWGGGGDGGGA
jgi:hypothetical protein